MPCIKLPWKGLLRSPFELSVLPAFQVDTPRAKPYMLQGHEREVTAVAWCPTDPHSIATCGDDATVKLWSVQRPWPPPAPKAAPRTAPQVQPPPAVHSAYCFLSAL